MVNTRSSQHKLLYYDPEIERTLRRIKKEQRKNQVDINESKARVCGICSELSHTTDACPTLQTEDVNALGGWRDHPNMTYGPKPPFPQATNPRPCGKSIIKEFSTNKRPIHIYKILTPKSSQLSGKLPSQPHLNPKEQVNRVMLWESEEVNELEELEVISGESSNTIKLLDAINLKIVRVLNNALIRVKNIFSLDDFYVIDTKHESTILLGHPFLKTSKALIDVANGSVVLESKGEKIYLNMINKALIPEANATDYVANYLEQIGVDNLETILDGMVAE
ncbi:DNA damage-inducible protein 1, partial [Bienertia sinuspersici]